MTLFLKHPMTLFHNGARESILDGLLKKLELGPCLGGQLRMQRVGLLITSTRLTKPCKVYKKWSSGKDLEVGLRPKTEDVPAT